MAASRVDYVEDIFTLLVKSVLELAAGAVVVMAQEIADVDAVFGKRYVGRPAKTPPPPQDWKLASENGFSFRSMSYALVPNPAAPASKGKPTYLLGTGWIDSGDIHYSNDGEHWEVVHSVPLDGGLGFGGIVWHPDDKCFYACWQAGSDPGEDDVFLRARIFRSTDGRAWTLHQDFAAFSDDEVAPVYTAATAAFRALCIKPENRGGIPDGIQGYDSLTKILIKPSGTLEWDILGFGGPNNDGIEIEIDGVPTPGGAGLPPQVFAVSFAGRIWNALVYDTSVPSFSIPTKIYMSADNGQNWVETFATTGYVPAGISSGAVADVGTPT